jgi:hypothetical protein
MILYPDTKKRRQKGFRPREQARLDWGSQRDSGVERLIEVGDDVVDVFYADA